MPEPALDLKLGGRFAGARKLIYAAVQSINGSADPDRLAAETKKLHQQIHDIYNQEQTPFARVFAKVAEVQPSFGSAVDAASTRASKGFESLHDSVVAAAQTVAQLKRYIAGLDPKWAAAVGVAGFVAAVTAGGLAAVPGPVLLGGTAFATLTGLHLPMLRRKLSRVFKGNGNNEPDTCESSIGDDFCLDDLVRAAVVWSLVLELQGNSEHVIVTTLQGLLTGCHPTIVESPDEAKKLLDEVDRRLRRLSAPTKS